MKLQGAGPTTLLQTLYSGGCIERYHTKGRNMLNRQNVAEHSWGLVAIIYAVNSTPSANLLLAAAFHDVSEQVTGDIPSPVKWANEAVSKTLNEITTAFENNNGIRFYLSDFEQKLLAFADRLEGCLFCLNEMQMGNALAKGTFVRYVETTQKKLSEFYPSNGDDPAVTACRKLLADVVATSGINFDY